MYRPDYPGYEEYYPYYPVAGFSRYIAAGPDGKIYVSDYQDGALYIKPAVTSIL